MDLQGAVEARNANYAAVVRHLHFRKRAWLGLHLADNSIEDHDDSDSDASEAAEGLEDAEQASQPAKCGTKQLCSVNRQSKGNKFFTQLVRFAV